jgi:hypothetical protein
MREERLEVSVTFNERHGYVASAPELRHPIVALSLASLRKRIEIALLPDHVRVVAAPRRSRRARAAPPAGAGALSRIAQLNQHPVLCRVRPLAFWARSSRARRV